MNWIEVKSSFLLACLIVSTVKGAEPNEEDELETGYLYEKPNISLLFPSETETEGPGAATEKEEVGSSTSPATKDTTQPEEEIVGQKPEFKSRPDGYLPPEEDDLLKDVTKENLETVAGDESYSKGGKGKTSVVKRKTNAVKEKEKVRVRQTGSPFPKQEMRAGQPSKDSKQGFRH